MQPASSLVPTYRRQVKGLVVSQHCAATLTLSNGSRVAVASVTHEPARAPWSLPSMTQTPLAGKGIGARGGGGEGGGEGGGAAGGEGASTWLRVSAHSCTISLAERARFHTHDAATLPGA